MKFIILWSFTIVILYSSFPFPVKNWRFDIVLLPWYQILPGFRVRIIPVLGTIPAIFGQVMASYVVTQLAEFQVQLEPVINLDIDHYRMLHQRLIEHEESLYGTALHVQVWKSFFQRFVYPPSLLFSGFLVHLVVLCFYFRFYFYIYFLNFNKICFFSKIKNKKIYWSTLLRYYLSVWLFGSGCGSFIMLWFLLFTWWDGKVFV